jgi:hypothetical protein
MDVSFEVWIAFGNHEYVSTNLLLIYTADLFREKNIAHWFVRLIFWEKNTAQKT